jgi:hypothetical protein
MNLHIDIRICVRILHIQYTVVFRMYIKIHILKLLKNVLRLNILSWCSIQNITCYDRGFVNAIQNWNIERALRVLHAPLFIAVVLLIWHIIHEKINYFLDLSHLGIFCGSQYDSCRFQIIWWIQNVYPI